jgi:tryptophan-rich sensory protein
MRTWLTWAAIAVVAGLTFAAFWERMPGMTSTRLLLYLVILFPYGLYAVMAHDRGPHRAVLLGGLAVLAGLWLWVMLRDPASGGLSLLAAVIVHLIATTAIGITVMTLGKRSHRSPPRTPL